MAEQYEFNQVFYESAWNARAKLLKGFLSQGYNAFAAIKKLESFERFQNLWVKQDGSVVITDKTTAQNNIVVGLPILKKTSSSGEIINTHFYANYNFNTLLVDLISKDDYNCIIELGCGYGRNLFNIFYEGGPLDIPYFGGEFTQSGVEIATELAKHTHNMKAHFFHFNHCEPNLDFIAQNGFKKVFVFTSHSIEQVKLIDQSWFETVANIADFVRCVHLEPFGFQMKISGQVSLEQKKWFEQKQWNQNFAEIFTKAHNDKIINIDGLVLEVGFGDCANPGSLLFWYSNRSNL